MCSTSHLITALALISRLHEHTQALTRSEQTPLADAALARVGGLIMLIGAAQDDPLLPARRQVAATPAMSAAQLMLC